MADLPDRIRAVIASHPSVRDVRLAGSRENDRHSPLSDWDFQIDASDPRGVAESLPSLVQPLEPIVAQFDRLAYTTNYMLLLRGPVKVDLLLDLPWEKLPPWEVSRDTLAGVDAHFWDWILWLASKAEKQQREKVVQQFDVMSRHLLSPLGAGAVPASIEEAVSLYRTARGAREKQFSIETCRAAEAEVCAGLRTVRYDV